MEALQPFAEAVRIVRKAAASETDVGRFARRVLRLLEKVEAHPAGLSRPSRRGTGKIKYVVETTQQGEVLTEERLEGRSKPFRCPRVIYEALAAALAAADRPLALDEIITIVAMRLGDRPADHQVRVALRMWMHAEPVLVLRNRARYRPSSHGSFGTSALRLWNGLRTPSR